MLLRERLRPALVRQASARPSGPAANRMAARSSPIADAMRPLGSTSPGVLILEARWPTSYRHGHAALGECLGITGLARSRLAPGIGRDELQRAAFIDVEATGLAGGTGTLAFLIGVATFEDGGLLLRQLFLADPAAEAQMLSALTEILDRCPAIVSFNGKSFDVPLLEARFILNRLRPPFTRKLHLDLLHPARRLYARRLTSCRLASLEGSVLGFDRAGDIPGWAVPRVYFDYLRLGWSSQIKQVLRHNRLDIVSLVGLLAAIGEAAGSRGAAEPRHALALARWDESRGDLREAARLYEAALRDSAPEDVRPAIRGLVRIHRRLAQWEELERALRAVLASSPPASARLEAISELAKLLERRRELRAAEALVRKTLSLLDVLALHASGRALRQKREEMERRLLRLRRRQAGAASGHAVRAEERLHLQDVSQVDRAVRVEVEPLAVTGA